MLAIIVVVVVAAVFLPLLFVTVSYLGIMIMKTAGEVYKMSSVFRCAFVAFPVHFPPFECSKKGQC